MIRNTPREGYSSVTAALLGFHGLRNTGDDALACAIGWWLYENKGIRRFVIPAEAKNLPVLPEPLEISTPLPWLKHGRWRIDWRWRLSVKRSDVVIFAGGANFHELSDFGRLGDLAQLARRTSSKVVGAIGVSLGPFETQTKMDECAEFLRLLDFLAVRDHSSYELARRFCLPFDVVEALDAAMILPEVYGLPTAPQSAAREDVLNLGISLCHVHPVLKRQDTKAQVHPAQVAQAIQDFSRNHSVRAHLFEFHGHRSIGDAGIVGELAAALDGKCQVVVWPYSPDPCETWGKIASMNMMIAMRYHSSIFSYCAGVPFVMLDYHPKCAAFAHDVGLPPKLVLSPSGFEPEHLSSKLELLVDPNCPHPRVAWKEALQRAKRNFDPLDSLL